MAYDALMPIQLQSVMHFDQIGLRSEPLRDALSSLGYGMFARVTGEQPLLEAFLNFQPNILILDVESPGEQELSDVNQIVTRDAVPVIVFARDDSPRLIQEATKAGASAYVSNDFEINRVRAILDAAIARFQEFQLIRAELHTAKQALSERKLVERAKGVLMKRKDFDEPTAYRAMQKMAMNRNVKLVDLSRHIIAAAEVLD